MISCCYCDCGINSPLDPFIELRPCKHSLCAPCHHEITASSILGFCPSCHEPVDSSIFCYKNDSDKHNKEEVHHSTLVWRVVSYISQKIYSFGSKSFRDPCWFLLQFTPTYNPILWTTINLFVVCYALFLLTVVGLYASEGGHKELKFADQSYLIYDFTTTVIWVLETLLGAVTSLRKKPLFSKTASMIHLFIALIFAIGSLDTLRKWKWKQENILVDAVWVALDLCAYTLVLIETAVHFYWKKRHKPDLVLETTTTTTQHDPLLASVAPFYDSLQRTYEKRAPRTLKPNDFFQLVGALQPGGGDAE